MSCFFTVPAPETAAPCSVNRRISWISSPYIVPNPWEFKAIELRRVVAGRDHHSAIDALMHPGVVEDRCNDRPEVDDLTPACGEASADSLAHLGGALSVVLHDDQR